MEPPPKIPKYCYLTGLEWTIISSIAVITISLLVGYWTYPSLSQYVQSAVNNHLEKENRLLKDRLTENEEKLTNKENRLITLADENKVMSDQLETIKKELFEARERLRTNETPGDRTSQQIAGQVGVETRLVAASQQSYEKLEKDFKDLEEKHNEVYTDWRKAAGDVTQLKEDVRRLEEDKRLLEKRIDELQK